MELYKWYKSCETPDYSCSCLILRNGEICVGRYLSHSNFYARDGFYIGDEKIPRSEIQQWLAFEFPNGIK